MEYIILDNSFYFSMFVIVNNHIFFIFINFYIFLRHSFSIQLHISIKRYRKVGKSNTVFRNDYTLAKRNVWVTASLSLRRSFRVIAAIPFFFCSHAVVGNKTIHRADELRDDVARIFPSSCNRHWTIIQEAKRISHWTDLKDHANPHAICINHFKYFNTSNFIYSRISL